MLAQPLNAILRGVAPPPGVLLPFGEATSTSPTGTDMLAQPEWLGLVTFLKYCSLKGSHIRHRIHNNAFMHANPTCVH